MPFFLFYSELTAARRGNRSLYTSRSVPPSIAHTSNREEKTYTMQHETNRPTDLRHNQLLIPPNEKKEDAPRAITHE
jgi:hypothetical protein